MKSTKLLYFKGINLNKENISILKKKFLLFTIKNIASVKNINKKDIEEISVIYCDQNFTYSSSFLNMFKNLKYLISSTTSTDFIDHKYCKKNNIEIISLENDGKFLNSITSTAEHTLGLILLTARNYVPAIKSIDKKNFNRRPFGGYKMLSKCSLGIIGYGRLGKLVARLSKNIFKNVYYTDTKLQKKNYKKKLQIIFKNCDFITLHIKSKNNLNFFQKKNLPQIKKSFYLINTSRGEVVDESFILKLLSEKKMLGYGTDVIKGEFTRKFDIKKNIIFKNRKKYNIVITPHIGGSTLDAWNLTEKRVITKLINKKLS
ncbi:hypothetical protein N8818_04515 [Candidatus Pelagibacter sp.]|nr:hypothetical protein [Candidatus Pelagibacter sp.]